MVLDAESEFGDLLVELGTLSDEKRHLVKNLHDRNEELAALRVKLEELEKAARPFLADDVYDLADLDDDEPVEGSITSRVYCECCPKIKDVRELEHVFSGVFELEAKVRKP